jgi:uncharacterized protein (TIGR03437 family)
VLGDASAFFNADANSLALTGLAFGTDPRLAPVATLALTNSASMSGAATFGGLGTITGTGLTDGATGATETGARNADLRVTMEGVDVPVLSFNSSRINIYVPPSSSGAASGTRSVVVRQAGIVRAAADARLVGVKPGIFTRDMTGAGEARALLVSGMRYTASPFPATLNNEPSVIAIFGTGWRNARVVTCERRRATRASRVRGRNRLSRSRPNQRPLARRFARDVARRDYGGRRDEPERCRHHRPMMLIPGFLHLSESHVAVNPSY